MSHSPHARSDTELKPGSLRVMRRLLAPATLALIWPALIAADTLRTLDGRIFEGRLSSVHGEFVLLGHKEDATSLLRLQDLDDASLATVATWIARQPPTAPWGKSESRVAKALAKRLVVLRDKKFVAFEPGDRPEPEFYLVYFGAYWCGPCRRFSPHLLEAYREMKAVAPDRFEVVFVSDDHDGSGQLDYAREVGMPWPVLRFNTSIPLFDRWRGPGIPCLVVLDREGELIFHSYSDKEYLGAQDPLEKFQRLLDWVHRDAPTESRWRLAVATHLLAAAAGDRAPDAYLVGVNSNAHRTLPKEGVTARVKLDARGRVDDVEFVPALDAVESYSLANEAKKWLFLPAIKGGKPVPCLVDVPISPDQP